MNCVDVQGTCLSYRLPYTSSKDSCRMIIPEPIYWSFSTVGSFYKNVDERTWAQSVSWRQQWHSQAFGLMEQSIMCSRILLAIPQRTTFLDKYSFIPQRRRSGRLQMDPSLETRQLSESGPSSQLRPPSSHVNTASARSSGRGLVGQSDWRTHVQWMYLYSSDRRGLEG